jgi:hypothetical protein
VGHTIIAVGGIYGFRDLVDPKNTQSLRSSCRVRLYLHRWSWTRTAGSDQNIILSNFKSVGRPIVEIDMKPDPKSYFQGFYTNTFVDHGVRSNEAHVNGFVYTDPVSEWKRFVDQARMVGLSTVSVVFSPNSDQFRIGNFGSAVWDTLRTAALYGHGITIDAPADFFFLEGSRYEQFIFDEIRWANKHNIQSAFIVSPGHSGDAFGNLTRQLVEVLAGQHALPSEFIVENYDAYPKQPYPNRVGSEHDSLSETGVALWILRHTN